MDMLLKSPPIPKVLPTVAPSRLKNNKQSNKIEKDYSNHLGAEDLMEYFPYQKLSSPKPSKSTKMMRLSELVPRMFPDKKTVFLDYQPTKVSRAALPTRKSSTVSPAASVNCESAGVLAITSTPFNEATREADRSSFRRQLGLLESFAGVKMSSFGNYVEKAINQDGFFAEKIDFPATLTDKCSEMQEFARKAVSYSREVDSIIFNCRCRVGVKIAKIK